MTGRQMLPDSMYKKNIQLRRIRVEWWLPGAAGRGKCELLMNGHKVSAKKEEF